MKENNLLPKTSEQKFYETFFEAAEAKMLPSGKKLQEFYEEFKTRKLLPPTILLQKQTFTVLKS
jgi:hypothetical protein